MAARNDFVVHGIGHTGITVRSLPQALEFWHNLLGLSILYQRELSGEVASKIVGVSECKIQTAMLRLPNGTQLELLEYEAPDDKQELPSRPCDVGNVHVALEVSNSAALIQAAAPLGWTAVDMQQLRRGDGSLWKMGYMRSDDGQTVELMERLEQAQGSRA